MGERARRKTEGGGRAEAGGRRRETANERFKEGSAKRFGYAVAAAAAVHVLVIWSGLGLRVRPPGSPGGAGEPMRAVVVLSSVEVPERPPRIAPPAPPRLAGTESTLEPGDLSIEAVEFDDPGLGEIPPLPPAPEAPAADEVMEGYRHVTPSMVRPALRNPDEVRRELERRYPSRLVNMGVSGRVVMLFWIDERGEVQRYEIERSSGHAALDRAAEEVVEVMEFQPAVQNGEPTKVIVALPITFRLP